MKKRCCGCKKEKPLQDFPRNKSQKYNRHPYCRLCWKAYTKKIRATREYKKYFKSYREKYFLDRPWMKTLSSVISRVTKSGRGGYKHKGIKNFLNKDSIKRLWERDRAFEMIEPSIDRINAKGDYTEKNCRFIELKENRLQGYKNLDRDERGRLIRKV